MSQQICKCNQEDIYESSYLWYSYNDIRHEFTFYSQLLCRLKMFKLASSANYSAISTLQTNSQWICNRCKVVNSHLNSHINLHPAFAGITPSRWVRIWCKCINLQACECGQRWSNLEFAANSHMYLHLLRIYFFIPCSLLNNTHALTYTYIFIIS